MVGAKFIPRPPINDSFTGCSNTLMTLKFLDWNVQPSDFPFGRTIAFYLCLTLNGLLLGQLFIFTTFLPVEQVLYTR